MQVKLPPKTALVFAAKRELHCPADKPKEVSRLKLPSVEFVSNLLDRRWALRSQDAQIHQVMVSGTGSCKELGTGYNFRNNPQPVLGESLLGSSFGQPSFYVVRDDLLHPLVNGNKARKLDALLPLLEDNSVTDVVTCGGCQSAHAAAVAISCAERGVKAHLLLRGEQPETLTGYALISALYGNVTYMERSLYARREEMLLRHASSIADSSGNFESLNNLLEVAFSTCPAYQHQNLLPPTVSRELIDKKVVIINEGAADVVSLLGVMRLVQYLSQKHIFGGVQTIKIVVDAGTGTTAVGLGLGAMFLGLPWEVHAVMLADTIDGYRKKEQTLISEFHKICNSGDVNLHPRVGNDKVVHWVERRSPRKFGNVLKGEVEECQRIAQQTGILVDPVYTLAGWELATRFSQDEGTHNDAKVVMLHTGGTLGLFGLAQRSTITI
ncbi:OLC1v1028478C2 [Oldenlandia corymbosa var. corymbosa]|uniref:OLC1v1028478C2 n=1 Tax=Oldenlandia corymbosa var. corymbosa TaxID=529605 RepID=A0AAV1CBV2_OLDCO|nr:OLC1v1028478C2 [Oldenlandia corymbosa var. corymbosa]